VDASGAEGAGVGADLLEGADECLYVGVREVPCEVSFDPVSVVSASADHGVTALVGEADED
jgi:hypothetical protein